jgi:CDP-glucose 4,6-dehydratase
LITILGSGSFSAPADKIKPYEAHLLKLDISKAMKMLNWKPALDFQKTVSFTSAGYLAELQGKDIYSQRVGQIREYVEIAAKQDISWTK